ncbi:hypothetical protein [uncultured Rikenella sp.]|uniref:hypothetical protein n=1 Tax=uncultured Rikenella sp. TaxID=368003 RepID=UPI0026115596|nr:hypothetical protein [uncultured Rikenella sp.]
MAASTPYGNRDGQLSSAERPAPGYRVWDSGEMSYVGNLGFSWSSVMNDIRGSALNFHSQGLYTNSSASRTHGFQLRCLSE